MALAGYARVNSTSQSLDIQIEQLKAVVCEKIFAEKRSGRTTTERDQLEEALKCVREGDVFVVTRLDRLARSIIDLRAIVDRLNAKGVGFRVLQQARMDTTTSEERLMLNMLAAFAEFEADIRQERQADGIAKAKEAGVYRGRKASIDAAAITRMRAEGLGATEIAKALGITRTSVYRLAGTKGSDV